MKRLLPELCWCAACCLLVAFFGLYGLGVELKGVHMWPLADVLPVIILAGAVLAAMVALVVAAYRMEHPSAGER